MKILLFKKLAKFWSCCKVNVAFLAVAGLLQLQAVVHHESCPLHCFKSLMVKIYFTHLLISGAV